MQFRGTICNEYFTCGEEWNLGGKMQSPVQFDDLKHFHRQCNTSYVWLGGEVDKAKAEEGNNNVITIKQPSSKVVVKIEIEV